MKKLKQLNLLFVTIMIFLFISGQPVFAKSSASTSSSSRSSSSSVSRASGSGFKSGSFSSTSSNTKTASSTSKSTSSTSTNSVTSKSSSTSKSTPISNSNSKALSSIPSAYSSHSVSNNYYYNVDSGGSSFWSNYWMYRALTPEHRTYVVDNTNVVAPSYTGFRSIIPDLITICIILLIIGTAIYIIKKRRG